MVTRAAMPAWRSMSGKADRRNQRGVLEQDQPEIGETGQRDADQLRQHDQPHRLAVGEADRIAALILAVRDRPEGRQEHLARIGREDDAERDHAGNEAVDLDRGVRIEEVDEVLQADLGAEIDQETASPAPAGRGRSWCRCCRQAAATARWTAWPGRRRSRSNRPMGKVASASETVMSTPWAMSSSQPSGPQLRSVQALCIGSRSCPERRLPVRRCGGEQASPPLSIAIRNRRRRRRT